jgi:hypothetical protein
MEMAGQGKLSTASISNRWDGLIIGGAWLIILALHHKPFPPQGIGWFRACDGKSVMLKA